MWGAQTRY